MVTYDSTAQYLESKTNLEAKIQAIDSIIDALFAIALQAASGDDITEYSLNDGQVVIKSVYRGAEAIGQSIKVYERMRQTYINRLNGRKIQLVHAKRFRR